MRRACVAIRSSAPAIASDGATHTKNTVSVSRRGRDSLGL